MSKTKRGTDASVYSAIHWFMLVLEKRAIELYSTNANSYAAIQSVLTQAAIDMNKIKGFTRGEDDDSCPDGYVFCDDLQLCCPACFGASATATASPKTKKK